MDKKIEIKEEFPLIDNIASQNEREFFQKVVTANTNIDDVLLGAECDMTVKTEIKSETPFIGHTIKQIKSEPASCSNYEVDRTDEVKQEPLLSDFGSKNEEKFLPEHPVIMDKKYINVQEIQNKIEIKEEPLWLEKDTSSICNDNMDGDSPTVKSSRLSPERVAGTTDKSQLLSADVPARDTAFSNGIDRLEYEYKKCDDECDVQTAKEYVHTDQYGECGNEEDRCIQPFCPKDTDLNGMKTVSQQCNICGKSFGCFCNSKAHILKEYMKCKTGNKNFTHIDHLEAHNLVHGGEKPHQCRVCNKNFTQLSNLKRHRLVHEGKKVHQCKVCNKSFTLLSTLKTHYLVHEGKKVHQCTICNKSFTLLSTLKTHYLVHEGQKPHQCKVCNKSFTQLSGLRTHHLVHEGKKPHQCKLCDLSFTQLSTLNRHNLIHEGKKAYKCEVCNKSFTHFSTLKSHNLVHEGKKTHQCQVCNKSFTHLSNLKRHNLVHEGRKPHICKVCGRSFAHLSTLSRHNLIHEDKKPYKCKVCDRSFTQLSTLKRHNLTHEDKKPYNCEVCDRGFTQLSALKKHNLIHEVKMRYKS